MSSTNAKTREEILAEMAALTQQLETEKAARIADVQERIDVLAAETGVTREVFVRDYILGDAKPAKRNAQPLDKPRRGVNPPKFESPYNKADTWAGGTGKPPKWFTNALAEGYTPDEMLIEKVITAPHSNGAAHA